MHAARRIVAQFSAPATLFTVLAVTSGAFPGIALAQCQPQWIPSFGFASLNGPVNALTVWDPDGPGERPAQIVAGGSFSAAGGRTISNIAIWNGSAWEPLGAPGAEGVNGTVYALSVFQGDLYAGGEFSLAGNAPATALARWNGAQWSSVETGPGGPNGTTGPASSTAVYAMTTFNNELVVGGGFSRINGQLSGPLARWDGAAWHTFQAGIQGRDVFALCVFRNELVVGGSFAGAGGDFPQPPAVVGRLLRWNGTAWNTLGQGPNNWVNSLAIYNNDLIAGGWFSACGVTPANRIARWDGQQWSTLGDGVGAPPSSIVQYGDDLLVGGAFTLTTGLSTSGIAKWNGAAWAGIGEGLPIGSSTDAMLVVGRDVIAGGRFQSAGGLPSRNLARISTPDAPSFSTQPPQQVWSSCGGSFSITATPDGTWSSATYQWTRNGVPVRDGPEGLAPHGGVVTGASGTTSARTPLTLSITGAAPADAGELVCTINTLCGQLSSTPTHISLLNNCCPADLDNDGSFANGGSRDGSVTIDDLLYFLVAFENGVAAADLDNDGDPVANTPDNAVDINDLLFFLARLELGC